MTRLSVVVPAYNEAKRISSGLAKLVDAVDPTDTEIIVVDDGSTDSTVELATDALRGLPAATVLSLPTNVGKGAAVKAGLVEATGSSIAFVDADMATDLADLAPLIAALDFHHIAIGSRSHKGSSVDRRPRMRAIMNRTFGMLVTAVTSLPYMDTQCGFKAFRGPVAKLLCHGMTVEHFGFDVQLLDLAARLGLDVTSMPVKWTDVEGSHVVPVRHGIETAVDVLTMRMSWGKVPPVMGVWFPGASVEDVASEHAELLIATDLVVTRQVGAAVLFPAVPPAVAGRRVSEILEATSSQRRERLTLPYRSLLAPRFGSFRRPIEVAL